MIPGSNTPPYRAPCDGTVLCANGPRYQHGNLDPTDVDVWLYNALVPDWATEGDYIAPYERFDSEDTCTGGASAACDFDGSDLCPDPTSSGAPCLEWQTPDPGTCQYYPGMQYAEDNPDLPPVSWYQPQMLIDAIVVDGGESYEVGDVLTIAGGTLSSFIGEGSGAATVTVAAIGGGGTITAVTVKNTGSYCTDNCSSPQTSDSESYSLPSSPNSVTGGHGTGATLDLTFGNQTMSFKQCFKYGYKNVQARRYWHGAPGYFFNGQVDQYQCPTDEAGDLCAYSYYEPFDYTTSQTKYLVLNYDLTYVETDSYDNPLSEGSSTISGELSVGSETGVITPSSLVYDDTSGALGEWLDGLPSMSAGPATWLNFISDYAGWSPYPGFTWTCDTDSLSATDSFDDSASASWSFGSDTASGEFSWTFHAAGNTQTYELSFTMSDSELSVTATGTLFYPEGGPNGPDETITQYFMLTVTLSSPNTSADILGDINTLLDEWDMTDDAEYPWRTDGNVSVAPLVSRNEVSSNVNPWDAGIPAATDYTDPNAGYYDGSIMGSPLPAGYQGYFDFSYADYEACDESDPPGQYLVGWGQQNTGQFGIPLNATQWTGNDAALRFGSGAWIFYELNPSWLACGDWTYAPVGGVYAQKWAETKMSFPSQNFFRPAGDDRFVYDQNNVYGITGTTNGTDLETIGPGSVITLQNNTTCTGAAPASTDGIWGGSAVLGFYELTAVTSDTVTLGDLVYNVPSDWQSGSSDESYCFGLLRWSTGDPATDPPAILGRAGVSAIAEYDSEPLVTELTTDSLPTLGMSPTTDDTIDVYDTHMTLIHSNLAVTRIDDSHFTVPIAVGSLTGAAWIMTHGAPAYYWDDEFPKGDYVYTDWTWWPRQICEANLYNTLITTCAADSSADAADDALGDTPCSGCPTETQTVYTYPFSAFTQTAACLPFKTNCPSVICISPNGESFKDGHTWPFPDDLNLDEEYGSGWQAQIQQIMEDLLYQAPHYPAQGGDTPCDFATLFEWEPDNGSCQSNVDGTPAIHYYPHPPMVEARITVPSGAPALPTTPETCGVAAVVIGWSSPVDIVLDDCVPANTLFPTGYGTFQPPGQNLYIWELWSDICDCVDDSGRFAIEYENQIIGCDT